MNETSRLQESFLNYAAGRSIARRRFLTGLPTFRCVERSLYNLRLAADVNTNPFVLKGSDKATWSGMFERARLSQVKGSMTLM